MSQKLSNKCIVAYFGGLFLPLIITIYSPVDTLINKSCSGCIFNDTELGSETVSKTDSGLFSNTHHQFHKPCVAFIISFCYRMFFLEIFWRPLLSSWWSRRIIRRVISWSRSTWTNTWHFVWWSALTPFLWQTVRACYCRGTLQLLKALVKLFGSVRSSRIHCGSLKKGFAPKNMVSAQ